MFRAFVNAEGSITVESMLDGYQAQPGEVLFADPPTEGQLDARFPDAVMAAARAKARAAISLQAEQARLQYVTAGSAKAMAYQEKAREAVAYLADPDPDPADYPLLGAEVGVTAETLPAVAVVVNGKYQLFRQIEALIGGTEAAAQKAVKEAQSVETIDAVLAGLSWPAPEA